MFLTQIALLLIELFSKRHRSQIHDEWDEYNIEEKS